MGLCPDGHVRCIGETGWVESENSTKVGWPQYSWHIGVMRELDGKKRAGLQAADWDVDSLNEQHLWSLHNHNV